jgi:hypothetical protein
VVPEVVRTQRVLVRPLRAADVDRDYDAVMASAPELRRWSASDWPSEGFTRAENLADLERHERDHAERQAFTYTIVDPSGARCLGCVYLVPVWDAAAPVCAGWGCSACVGFWVRSSELARGLEGHVFEALVRWFETAWSFDGVLFTNAAGETRQAALLAAAGLERQPLAWPDESSGWAFRAALRATRPAA